MASSLWYNKVGLRGTFQDINRQWSWVLQKALVMPKIHELCIRHSKRNMCVTSDEMEEKWLNGLFIRTFPFMTVKRIKYYGVADGTDHVFWISLLKCCCLEYLSFRSRFSAYHGIPTTDAFRSVDWSMKSKLQHLEIDFDSDSHTKHLPYRHLRTLIFKIVRQPAEVRRCLKSAAKTLVELQLWGVNHNDIDEDTIQGEGDSGSEFAYKADEPISLPQLKIFRAIFIDVNRSRDVDQREKGLLGMTKVSYDIRAHRVTEMVYDRFLGWDQVLFESCHQSLKKVSWEVNDYNAQHIYKAMERLPACEELCIKMFISYRYYWPNLWLGERPDGPYIIRSLCLPKLEKLTVEGDNIIDGEEIIRLVEHKQITLGHTFLSTLVLKDCYRIRKDAIVRLKKLVPEMTNILSEL